MNKQELLRLREKYISEISKDIKMMDEDPESEFWINDYNFNSGVLHRVNTELAKLEGKDE